jgi:hypothetical protein
MLLVLFFFLASFSLCLRCLRWLTTRSLTLAVLFALTAATRPP